MKTAILYKIVNTVNGMVYYGIVYKKDKTVSDRFEEHMTGRGGSLLYQHGVLEYGRDSFVVEELERGNIDYIRNKEVELNKNNLYPIGYNGNTSHAILTTEDQREQALAKRELLYKDYPERRPTPPNWKGKTRSPQMRSRLSESKKGHAVSEETRKKNVCFYDGQKKNRRNQTQTL